MSEMLPYGRQSIDDDDVKAVEDVLRSDFLTTGPKVKEFEDALSNEVGADHVVVCSNGTAALHLSALALGLGEGDAVIVPSLTFLATANAVRYTGAEVVFSDVNPQTGLIEPLHLEHALAQCGDLSPKAVFPVHLAGQCADLVGLSAQARTAGLNIVADACHALGGAYENKPVGACSYEDMSVFSFHPVKTISMGEGGAVTTNNAMYAEKMKRLRSHGMVPNEEVGPWYYEMVELGYNFRATDIQCALGCSQLKKLQKFVERRSELVGLYDRLLSSLPETIRPPERVPLCEPGWHLYSVRIDFEKLSIDRGRLMEKMREKGICTQVHYIPVHMQPYYKERYGETSLPGAEHYYRNTLSLPLFPAMTDDDVVRVVNVLSDFCV